MLAAWTDAAARRADPRPARDLFWFLCCLEEADRIRPVLEGNWADLWNRLERDDDPPGLDEALAAIAARGLAAIQPETDQAFEEYGIHPGVADAGRDLAGTDFRDAVDTELAAYWHMVTADGRKREAAAGTTWLVDRAGLAAAPYLLRQEQWNTAGSLLEEAFQRDQSRATAASVLPALEAITATGHDPSAAGLLAQVLMLIDPAAAERQLRTILEAAVTRGEYQSASTAAGYLTDMCRDSGRLAEALTLVAQKAGYTQLAGLGPWTQLVPEV